MAKPIVSILIPVYNVENYLDKCLDSVISQTMNNIEIICVNDGSTDHSGEILEKYQKKDKRIIVVNKENGGLPSARNAGLEIALQYIVLFYSLHVQLFLFHKKHIWNRNYSHFYYLKWNISLQLLSAPLLLLHK